MVAWAWVSILLSWHLYYKSCSWDFHSGKKWKMCRKTTLKAINSIGMKINIIISCEIVRENWYVFKFFHEWLRKWGRPIASTCFLLWNHRMTPTVPEQVFPQPLPFYQPSIKQGVHVPSPSVPCPFFAKIVESPANWTKRAFA